MPQGSGRGWTRWRRVAAAALVVALPATYLTLDALDVVPGFVTSDLGREEPAGAPPEPEPDAAPAITPATAPLPAATPAEIPADTPAEVPTATPGPTDTPATHAAVTHAAATRAGLAKALAPVLADPGLGGSIGVEVRDAAGTVLFAHDAARPRVPASTAKVLTAVALAHATDLTARFTTKVVLLDDGSAGVTRVALIAGGDNLLAPDRGEPGEVVGQAGLGDLARATADRLQQRGAAAPVRVVLDDTFAAGPPLAPGWHPADVALGLTGPVAMLGLATDRAEPYRPSSTDPAMHAASAFAGALTAAGVQVVGRPTRAQAPADAPELAVVHSAPVGDVLAVALDDSDNDLTETVARWGCHGAGAPTTFQGCAAWVRTQLAAAGLDVRAVRLADTSGLSGGSQVPVSVLGHAMALASGEHVDGLSGVLARLPVAGLTGTLDERFFAAPAARGVGLVRAKTGTLTGVSGLTGSVVDAQGRLLTFAVVADRVPGTTSARLALDRLAATLATCGCQ